MTFGLVVIASAIPVQSEPTQHGETMRAFEAAVAALEKGAYTDAIASLEQLSDRGIVSPDVSYNRALAYLLRAESPKQREGDLGQVVAGLRESAVLLGGDEHVSEMLNAVRREISRLRAQRGLDPVVVEPPLARAIVGLAPENVWAILALLGTAALCVGLVLLRTAPHSPTRLAGQISCAVGLLFVVGFGGLAAGADYYHRTSQEAVVVSSEAQLLDRSGNRLTTTALDVKADAIPEGASVFLTGQSGRLAQVNWGSFEAWIESDRVRLLATP